MLQRNNAAVMKLLVYLLCLCTGGACLDYTCTPNSSPVGVSLPRGDIYLLQNSSQTLSCHLNPESEYYVKEGLTSSDLYFSTPEGELESRVISHTAISATFTAREAGTTHVTCLVRRKTQNVGICIQRIFSGYLPQAPVNFTCLSENWHNLNCSWDQPVNPVQTHYDVKFIEPGITATNRSCPYDDYHFPDVADPGPNCFLDLTTTPPYRQTVKIYTFYFNATNPLLPGGKIYKEVVDHYAIIKPGSAQLVNLTAVSASRMALSYRVPREMQHFEPGLKQFVRYRNSWTNQWTSVDTSHILTNETFFPIQINGLQPYTNYTFEIKMISTTADLSRPELWSDPALVTGRTNASSPSQPAAVDVGSFEVLDAGSRRTVFVYWSSLDPSQYNGPQFRYIAKDEGGKIKPINITDSYAKFEGVPVSSMTVRVGAANAVGLAPSWSVLVIPGSNHLAGLSPRSLTKIWKGSGRFEIAWRAPARVGEVETYTLFWCRAEKDRPHQCHGHLDWKTIQVLSQPLLPCKHTGSFFTLKLILLIYLFFLYSYLFIFSLQIHFCFFHFLFAFFLSRCRVNHPFCRAHMLR